MDEKAAATGVVAVPLQIVWQGGHKNNGDKQKIVVLQRRH